MRFDRPFFMTIARAGELATKAIEFFCTPNTLVLPHMIIVETSIGLTSALMQSSY